MSSKDNNRNGVNPLWDPSVSMPDWWKEFVSRFEDISAENEGEPQVIDPIHEKGLD